MCFGSSSKASDQARADEERRKAEINAANQRVEGIFSSSEREGQYDEFVDSTRGIYQTELDRQHGDASRGLKFANARSGLSGGSQDADSNSRLAQDYLKGLLGIERKAQGAGSLLRSQDQSSKLSLFQQILGGLDITTASTQAAHALQNNVGLARSDAHQTEIGDLFGDFSQIFKDSKTAAADRRSAYDFNTWYAQRPKSTAPVAGAGGGYGGLT